MSYRRAGGCINDCVYWSKFRKSVKVCNATSATRVDRWRCVSRTVHQRSLTSLVTYHWNYSNQWSQDHQSSDELPVSLDNQTGHRCSSINAAVDELHYSWRQLSPDAGVGDLIRQHHFVWPCCACINNKLFGSWTALVILSERSEPLRFLRHASYCSTTRQVSKIIRCVLWR